ncbi:MAG: hypothetical protein PF692_08565 [Kiritimatiellae bacterium]|jgi:hypothetical protein|nr:hypothetical protein [Kiritimatiellia bacterium]
MKNKYYICLILLLKFSCLIFADDAYVPLTVSGNVHGIQLFYSNYVDKSSSYILGDFIKRTNTLLTNVNVNITLVERNCRPVISPIYSKLQPAQLLEIAESPYSSLAFGDINISKYLTLTNVYYDIAELMERYMPVEFIIKGPFYPNQINYLVGPPEYMFPDETRRYAYHIDGPLKNKIENLPNKLNSDGNSVAYNSKEDVLVVIDEKDSNIFTILDILEFKLLNKGIDKNE